MLFLIAAISLLLLMRFNEKVYIIKDNIQWMDSIYIIFSIIGCYLISILLDLGYFNEGLVVNGINLIPSYILAYYFIIPMVYMMIRQPLYFKNMWKINSKIGLFTILICLPNIITSIVRIIVGAYNYISPDNLIQNIFRFIFMAALLEELFFRGFLYNFFKNIIGKTSSTIITSLIFTFWHMSLVNNAFSNYSMGAIYNLIAIMVLGITNCLIIERTKSIIPCIVFHAVINGIFLNLILLFVN
ncbi:type II CAAX prenyl endopeptidase Rce1 family protein [Vallitalea guaymasensis]|uniref:CPBP family glutamic-type intramembrane protease n=1 Tax=Vallitalea guaymasensis TaxID=1185412 RepID=UPI000DE307B9|nr:CPBP family intramembrane glutamic endopeptidase [Vallitalea guaymasensis]